MAYTGVPPDASVVAVPALKLSGEFVSQTMACAEAVADAYQYMPPTLLTNKARQTCFNLYDIFEQTFKKRNSKEVRNINISQN